MNSIYVANESGITVSFPVSGIDIELIYRAKNAVMLESGAAPEYYLVGIRTFYELQVMFGQFEQQFGKLVVDTTREHYFAAVARVGWQIGRPIPPHSVWTYGRWGWEPMQ